MSAGTGMGTKANADLPELQARMKAQSDYAGQHGEQWVQHHAVAFKELPKGTHVAINCRTGEYVVGHTALEAVDAFEQRFGKGNEIGYMIEIGGGVFVGGGIV